MLDFAADVGVLEHSIEAFPVAYRRRIVTDFQSSELDDVQESSIAPAYEWQQEDDLAVVLGSHRYDQGLGAELGRKRSIKTTEPNRMLESARDGTREQGFIFRGHEVEIIFNAYP
jgi:hypothetical protein